MGPIAYSLCQKPVIGLLMWATSMCTFPPLFDNVTLNVSEVNSSISVDFEVEVERNYNLEMSFAFASKMLYKEDDVVGSRYSQYCFDNVKFKDIPLKERTNLGKPLEFTVLVKEKESKLIVYDETIESLCITSHRYNSKVRLLAKIPLKEGEYIVNVTSLNSYKSLNDVNTTLTLNSGRWLK